MVKEENKKDHLEKQAYGIKERIPIIMIKINSSVTNERFTYQKKKALSALTTEWGQRSKSYKQK